MEIIKVDNVSVSFGRGKGILKALKGLSLKIRENDVIKLYGPNGSGKTTLLRVISGLLVPPKGTVKFEEGVSLFYLPCGSRGFHARLTVEENLLFYCRVFDAEVTEFKSRIGNFFDRFSFAGLLHRSFQELSAGQKGMASLALAVGINSKVMLLDEPFMHLERTLAFEVAEFLKERTIALNGAIVVATQREDISESIYNRVVKLDRGTLVSDDVG